MTAITNNSLPISIDGLINYVLTDSDDPVFNELAFDSTPNTEPQKNQEISSKGLKRKTIDCLNQTIAKKPHIEPSSFSLENNTTISSAFKRKLINTINQIYEKANALSLEKIQTHYANQLNVDLQEVKNIYLAVSTHCPTASKSSVIIKASFPVKSSVLIPPKSKENLVNAINQKFSEVKKSHLEKIQAYCADQLKLDLQEVKNIYSAASPHYSTMVTTTLPRKLKKLDFSLEDSSTGKKLVISPEAKKNLADNINCLSYTTDASLEEIQVSYAHEFKIALQDIKDICLAISTHCPSVNTVSKIKIIQ